ncbi:hypothetical protein DPMN_134296 [Dreissena polymorpha]|uniref:Uncharacterized protein n=1 Tax=Dreissena polymorpha TaxID=45954 RepID=A0A9D4JAK7_DREPO|nr:hypothetical protein DPMN_134296 [Dreissena polymorpha]
MARQRPTRIPPRIDVILKGNFGWARPMLLKSINEEVMFKHHFGWAWPMWGGAPQVEIDRIVIRKVQYQLEVNRCRNEEVICGLCGRGPGIDHEEVMLKQNFGWAWSKWAGRPRIDRIVKRDVQYQSEVNRCRNEVVNFQGSMADGDFHSFL